MVLDVSPKRNLTVYTFVLWIAILHSIMRGGVPAMRTPHRRLLLASACLAILSGTAIGQDKVAESIPKYRNPNLAIDDRVADLLSRMTLEEKVQQLTGGGEAQMEVIDPTGTYTTESARGTLMRWSDPHLAFTPKKSAILRNGVQRYLKEKTRLGIPQLFMAEALLGFMEYGTTSFPQALGLSSTLAPELV